MKILIIRFSSIGDIILTTPVVRCIKNQVPDAEIHYLTKLAYKPLLEKNPYIDKLLTIENSVSEIVPGLRAQQYDHIIDLHKNLRTKQLLFLLKRRAHSFNKLNKKKLLLVWFKINLLPKISIVDRYLRATEFLGVQNDGLGLDYFIPPGEEVPLQELPEVFRSGFVAVVTGAKQFTKQIPAQTIVSLCKQIDSPVILIGGPQDHEKGESILNEVSGGKLLNACGVYNLNQSASLLRQASSIITADTGMMHIAAALKKEVVSVWGNTMPDFGMFPYFPSGMEHLSHIIEVRGLTCKPCTKLGFDHCPRGHFLCMMGIDENEIMKWVKCGNR
jgi:ADP-heptose:LPS heptosyltransferase